jgi:hypothetical protein
MYREPHLQKKSDECAIIWREWHCLWKNNDPKHIEVREKWSKCCDEFSEMISQEVRTNSRYHGIRM